MTQGSHGSKSSAASADASQNKPMVRIKGEASSFTATHLAHGIKENDC
jgi:hypothetical protein